MGALFRAAREGNKRNKFPKRRNELTEELLKQANGRVDVIKGALFRAAREGNFEFVTTALRLYPNLAIELDDNNHTILHVAVQHRHVDVFNAIMHMIGYDRTIIKLIERESKNILHLTAKLPLSGLEVVQGGAALQLHRELLWFKEVKKVFGLQHAEHKNKSHMLLFEKEHEELRREGEKWLKNTTDSSMLVAALLTTVSFLAGLSAPRMPIVLDDFWFKTFATSNAITFIFSGSSVLFFLSIITSTFSMDEFLKSLPFKLFLGLFSLSISILMMMAGCFAALFGISKHRDLQYSYPVAVVACIPVLFLARLYLPLFYGVFRSTLSSFLQFRRNRFSVPELENQYY